MRDRTAVRDYLKGEIEALDEFDFIVIGPAGHPLHRVEIGRTEEKTIELRVPGRLPGLPAIAEAEQKLLAKQGFANEDASDCTQPWISSVPDATGAVKASEEVLSQVFNEQGDEPLDIVHGSHRSAHEARVRLAAIRERVEKLIESL
jgi:hypothetical protein